MNSAAKRVGFVAPFLVVFATACASTVTPGPDPNGTDSHSTGDPAPGAMSQSDGGDIGATGPAIDPSSGIGSVGTDPNGGALTSLSCQDMTTPVGLAVILHADAPPRVAFEWSIEQAPDGSVAQIELPDVRTPRFTPDIPGDWLIRVQTHDGQQQLANCVIVLHAQ